jgi:hypothetical protein
MKGIVAYSGNAEAVPMANDRTGSRMFVASQNVRFL